MHTDEETLSIESIISTIDGLVKSGINNIYLSGGEPMMRWEGIIEILKMFSNTTTNFFLLTTAWKLYPEKIDLLKKMGLKGIMVSFDSQEEKTISFIKKDADVFNNALKAIEYASNKGLLVVVDMVLTRKLTERKNLIEFLNQTSNSGVHFINCYLAKSTGKKEIEEMFRIKRSEFNEFKIVLKEIQTSSKFKDSPIIYSPDIWEANRGCSGGKLFIYIDPQGNVKPCPFLNSNYGNIISSDIKTIINNIYSSSTNFSCPSKNVI